MQSMHSDGYLHKTCNFCKKDMSVGPGDTIYGDKWYHSYCWAHALPKNCS